MKRLLTLAGLLAVLSACSRPADEQPAAGAPAPPPAPAPAAPAAYSWAVSPAGAGPVRVGMTLAELAPFLADSAAYPAAAEGCGYVRLRGAPDSTGFMIVEGRLARIEVRGGSTPTQQGDRVGDTEAQVEARYPGKVRTQPHKYTDGHYLVVVPGAPADTLHRLVFETDSGRVVRFRAGVYPPVEYVEGCS